MYRRSAFRLRSPGKPPVRARRQPTGGRPCGERVPWIRSGPVIDRNVRLSFEAALLVPRVLTIGSLFGATGRRADGSGRVGQYESDEMISPPALVPRAHHALMLTEDLTERTEPSHNSTFTEPGCRLLALCAIWRP